MVRPESKSLTADWFHVWYYNTSFDKYMIIHSFIGNKALDPTPSLE